MDFNGGDRKKITQRLEEDIHPAWAAFPNWNQAGNRIAFAKILNIDTPIWSSNIFLVDPDGSNLQQITFSPVSVQNRDLRWSQDGRSIVFASNRDHLNELNESGENNFEIYWLDTLTQKTIRITTSRSSYCPVWMP
jgi:Tol biopolymer transport system component